MTENKVYLVWYDPLCIDCEREIVCVCQTLEAAKEWIFANSDCMGEYIVAQVEFGCEITGGEEILFEYSKEDVIDGK